MIKLTEDKITPSLSKKARELATVPQQAFVFFKDITPIRSGNARGKTSLRRETIKATYPYAQRLDQGYSKQAPTGMSKPLKTFLKKLADTMLKRK